MGLSNLKNSATEQEALKIIKNYISSSSYNYAILIDGGWGCGKTFFVKNKLIPSMTSAYGDKKVIYISLYGVSSKEDITQKIITEILPFNKIRKCKAFEITSRLSKTVIFGLASAKGFSIDSSILKLSDFISLYNCILIFDDLERCEMEINETLGFINEYIEHDGIKCLIIANENEIAATKKARNIELKYLVASSEHIDCQGSEQASSNPNQTTPQSQASWNINNKMSLEKLQKNVNNLFGEDELYQQIKEKLIGLTIHYRPEMMDIIENVVSSNKAYVNIRGIIEDNIEFVADKYNHYNHPNIRTLLFSFDKFLSIYNCLYQDLLDKDARSVLDEVFRYTVTISIIYKMGERLPQWAENVEVEEMSLDGIFEYKSRIKRFRFVDEFVEGARLDKDRVIEVITRHLEIAKNQVVDMDDPLFKLSNFWWKLEDQEAASLLQNINKELANNPSKYKMSSYARILSLNIMLKRIGITDNNIDEILELMIRNLNTQTVINAVDTFGVSGSSFTDESDIEYYKICIQKLNAEAKKHEEQTGIKNLDSVFGNAENWSNELLKYVKDHNQQFLSGKGFLMQMDYEKLFSAITNSTSEGITTFRSIIRDNIYHFSNIRDFYSVDIGLLLKLKNDLSGYYEEVKQSKKIYSTNLFYLTRDIESVIERLQ